MTIPKITEISTPPSQKDPDNFVSRSDTFFSELPTLATDINSMVNATNIISSELSTSVTAAISAATAVEAASNATAYDTGKTGGYAIGDVVYSTAGFSYRCVQDQAEGAVEAITNTAYWTQLGGLLAVSDDVAPTLGGNLDADGKIISSAVLKDTSETVNALGDLAGGTDDIDLELGNVVSATISTGEQTFTFSNPPATGINGSFTLFLTNGGSQVINWPSSVDWVDAEVPELTATGLDVLVFTTNDNGTNWLGFVAGLAVA